MKREVVHLNFYCDEEFAEAIRRAAQVELRSQSQFIRLVLEDWLVGHKYLLGRAKDVA
jgi:hypothetical protein